MNDQMEHPPVDEGLTLLQPLMINKGFSFSDSEGIYSPPFVSKEEACGFLSGSEHSVLCSKTKPLYSRNFAQCGGALVRNRNTGYISLIHESLWSVAASTILTMQRPDDIDVVILKGLMGYTLTFDTVRYYHDRESVDLYEAFTNVNGGVDSPDPTFQYYNLKHVFSGDGSQIRGISRKEAEDSFLRAARSNQLVGKTQLLGNIEVPNSGPKEGRLFLLFRPTENFIWVYESGAHTLFKYPGFPK